MSWENKMEFLAYQKRLTEQFDWGHKEGLAGAAKLARDLAEAMSDPQAKLGATIVAEELERLCKR